MGLVTEYPSGLIIICLLLGAGYTIVLYFHDFKRGLKYVVLWSMCLMRFLSVSLISFLLLTPLIKQSEKLVEKPIIIIGVDNSRSIILAGDSGYYKTIFPARLNKLIDDLRQKCDVRVYSLGDNLRNGFDASYNEPQTDISAFFNEVITRYTNRNAAALILASDGIFNEGTDPFYAAQKISFPVYTIAFGDTNVWKDISIRKILVNKTAYKGDKFPVEILVEMNKCAGLDSKLSVMQGSRMIDSRNIRANSDRSMQKVSFILDAREIGVTRYSLRLTEQANEVNKQNNNVDFFIEVLDSRQKIALLFNSPHPDVTAIQSALAGSSHFGIDLIRTDSMPKNFDKYDLVILNQLPSVTNVSDFSSILKSRASMMFIIGTQTDINAFNNLRTGLIINSAKNAYSESQAIFNDDFSLFTMAKKDAATFSESPPLQSPFGLYQVSPLTEILSYQKIGTVATRTPMILFSRSAEKKIGIIAGENIWRWRMNDYVQQSNHEAFDVLIDKIAQYLSTKEDKTFFRIHTASKISENEPVEMDAEVFNASYELINDPDVNITITDAAGKVYPFIFSKINKSYFLNAGLFPVGEYTYKATTKVGTNNYQKTGKLFIEQVNLENSNLIADHQLLFRIASAHDGEMVGKDSIGSLAYKITSRHDIRSVAVYHERMSDLIGNPWLLAIILALLMAEWVIRKREGR